MCSSDLSTKGALSAVRQFSDRKKVLVVVARSENDVWRSLRSVEDVHLIVADQLNAYDVVNSDDVVFSHDAIKDSSPVQQRAKLLQQLLVRAK